MELTPTFNHHRFYTHHFIGYRIGVIIEQFKYYLNSTGGIYLSQMAAVIAKKSTSNRLEHLTPGKLKMDRLQSMLPEI